MSLIQSPWFPPRQGVFANRKLVEKVWCLSSDLYATLVGDEIIRYSLELVANWAAEHNKTIDFEDATTIDWIIEGANRLRGGYDRLNAPTLAGSCTNIYLVNRHAVWTWVIDFNRMTKLYYRRFSLPSRLMRGLLLSNYGSDVNVTKVKVEEDVAFDTASQCIDTLHVANEHIGRGLPYDPRGRFSGVIVPQEDWRRVAKRLAFTSLSEQIAGICGYLDQFDSPVPPWSPF